MRPEELLETNLLDLLFELRDTDIRRLREHPQFTAAADLSGFISALAELFPAGAL